MQELAPKLEKLRLKAVAKARDYMLGRIAELKKPKTHVQVGEQQARREGGPAAQSRRAQCKPAGSRGGRGSSSALGEASWAGQ